MRRLTSMLVAVVALSAIAAPAYGQFGNLRRKAKDKATQAVTGQNAAQPKTGDVKFDATMLQLNAQNVARVIKGLQVRSGMKGPGGLTAQQMRDRAATVREEGRVLEDAHPNERNEFNNKKGEAESCVSEKMNESNNRRYQELQRRIYGMTGVNTPEKTKFMKDYMAIAQEQAQAAASGDTARVNASQVKYNKLLGIDAHADTLKARSECNVPPAPPWMHRADSLGALSDTLFTRARETEATAGAAAARAAEMTPEQFAMAVERVEGFVMSRPESGMSGAYTLYVFTPAERDALMAQLPVLQKYFHI